MYIPISDSKKCITKLHTPAYPPPPIPADVRNVREEVLIIRYMCSPAMPLSKIHVTV